MKTLKNTIQDAQSTLSISLFIGASVLITSSTLIGTLLGSGLELVFYAFYISGNILLIFLSIQYLRHLTLNKLGMIIPSKQTALYITLSLFSLLFYLYFSISNPMPRSDAAEAYLPMARYFSEYDGIPAETSVYFLTGNKLTIPPGISLLQAFAFTITQSFSPMNLSFLEIAFLLCFSTLTYSYTIRCGFSKVEANLAAILMLNLPYWGYYFRYTLHYVDLESAFMVSASIYLLLITWKDINTKRFKSILPVLGVGLFATFTSKVQSLIILALIFVLILKLSSIWRRHKNLCSLILFFGYALAVPILTSKMYVYTTIFGGEPFILFFTAVSLVPLFVLLRIELQEEDKVTVRTWLPLLIIVLLSLYWYMRTWYVSSSILPPIQTGESAWAGEILKRTMKWGGLEYLYTKYSSSTFNILHSIYSFPFLIPLIIGVKYFQSLKDFFQKGIKLWLLIGITVFLGVLEKSWRYPIFFMLPIPILVSKGIFEIVRKFTYNYLVVISLVFFLTFSPIDSYLMSMNPAVILISSTLGWIILLFVNSLNAPLKMWKPKFRIGNESRRNITVFVLSTVLLVSGFTTIQHYSKEYYVSRAVTDLYGKVSADAASDRVLISIGASGIYYSTGVNTLNIVFPDGLAVLRPLFEAPDIEQGLRFLIRDFKVGGAIFRAEGGGLYREWYVNLLDELPELRILHNPQLFKTALYIPRYFYFLNLVNESWNSYGVLDVVVRGIDPAEEASLFLPYDYGQGHTFVAYSREGLKLIIFLYFPRLLIERTVGEVSFETSVKLEVTTRKEDSRVKTTEEIRTQSLLNLSKIVQVNAGIIRGSADSVHTSIKIDSIKVHVVHETFEAYFQLVPKSPSISFPGTWLTYFPSPSLYYDYPNYTWTHLGSSLIETNASLLEYG